MWAAILILGGIAFVSALGLGIAAIFFAVEIDPKIKEIEGVLPGANCGGCGFAGCSGFAEAVVAGNADPGSCAPGGTNVAEQIGRILGLEIKLGPKMVARVFCRGGIANARDKYKYSGVIDCRASVLVADGHKACGYACLGLGTCVQACHFGAITMGSDHVPGIKTEKCIACGKCVEICPRQVIRLVPESQRFVVLCNSHDKGKTVKDVCKIGCIACQICVKKCPAGAVRMEDSLAVIDPEKCISCGICWEKCPQKIIWTDEKGLALMARAQEGKKS